MKPYYDDGRGIQIFHGDCREVLSGLPVSDCVLTDPPYGINAARTRNSQQWGWTDFKVTGWDKVRTSSDLIIASINHGVKAIVWGGNYFTDVLPPSPHWLIWDKGQTDFSLADAELAWCSWDGAIRRRVFSRPRALQDGKQHPTAPHGRPPMNQSTNGQGVPIDERMKAYEEVFHAHLMRRMPVIVRVDGRAFHGVTRGWPGAGAFSNTFMEAMRRAARVVADDMQGFRVGYMQSDEASFLLVDYDQPTTEAWFGNDLQKIASIAASEMTRAFNKVAMETRCATGTFDARAFNVPREDVANYFLWRARDWSRNSLQMYARSFFPQSALHGKNREAMHEMLHGIGQNWTTDLDDQTRNGTWLLEEGERYDVLPKYAEVNGVVAPLLVERAPVEAHV